MADIKIYGTLKNDTGEPIVYASQVYDKAGGKSILDLIDEKIQAIDIPEYELPQATREILGGIRLGKYLKEDPNARGTVTVDEAVDSLPGVISEIKVGALSKGELLKALKEFTGSPAEESHPYFPDYIKLVPFGTWAMTEGAFETFKAKMDEAPLEDYASISDNTITIGEDSLTIPTLKDIEATTEEKVKAAVAKIVDGAPEAYDTLKEIGTWISTHEDAYDLLNKAVTGKADKATTLAGYGITDASISTDGTITLGAKTIKPITEHQSLANYLTTAAASSTYATKTELNAKAAQTDVDSLKTKVEALEKEPCMTEEEAEAMVREIFGAKG